MPIPNHLIWPAIRIAPEQVALDTLAIGQSRFGGQPDLPDGFAWPTWCDDSRPLSFLAQINLREVSGMPCSIALPDRGWLLFFYDASEQPWGFDPNDRGGCHVAYIDVEPTALARRALPIGIPEEARFNACKLAFEPALTHPDPHSLWVDPLGLTADQRYEMYEEYDQVMDASVGWHQIGGHPKVIQNPMELECQLVSHGLYCGDGDAYRSDQGRALAPGARDWRCVLTIESDDEAGWMWGDDGNIYFWMREADIAERRFDKAWAILQCY